MTILWALIIGEARKQEHKGNEWLAEVMIGNTEHEFCVTIWSESHRNDDVLSVIRASFRTMFLGVILIDLQ